jgi:hypothetical protein
LDTDNDWFSLEGRLAGGCFQDGVSSRLRALDRNAETTYI